jgi:peptidoglycan/LPS O-acetylase OafA/YrhL
MKNKSQQKDSNVEYYGNFDTLRLCFALFVLVSHSWELRDGSRIREPLTRLLHSSVSLADMAVDGFFVLSGFLITASWFRAGSGFTFLNRRLSRIVPGFLVAYAVSVLVIGAAFSDEPNYFRALDLKSVLLSAIALQPPPSPPVFHGSYFPVVNGAMWTISYEFRCYLLTALAGALGLLRPKLAVGMLLLLLPLSLLRGKMLALSLGLGGWNQSFGYIPDLIRLVAFYVAGTVAYLYRKELLLSGRNIAIVFILLVVSLAVPFLYRVLGPICWSLLSVNIALGAKTGFKLWRPAVDISFGTYLYGWPIQKMVISFVPGIAPELLFLVSGLLALGAGFLSWHTVEKWFLKRRRNAPHVPAAVPS